MLPPGSSGMKPSAARIPFLRAWTWEFLQNLPLFLAFTFGLQSSAAGDLTGALAAVAAGAISCALLIRWTERRIRPGPEEAPGVTLANIFIFGASSAAFVLYFSWNGGRPLFDAALGLAAGASASLLQFWAAGEPVSARHTFSLGAAGAMAILCIRFFVLDLPPFPAALILNAPVTTLIVLIEYRS